MKFFLSILTVLFFYSSSLYLQNVSAQEKSDDILKKLLPEDEAKDIKRNPEEYDQNSFPDWAYYVYRFGAIAVGSLPFSLLFATVGYDTYKTIDNSISVGSYQGKYMPLYFSGPDKPVYNNEEVQQILISTMFISIGISTIDLAIQLVKQWRGKTIQSFIR